MSRGSGFRRDEAGMIGVLTGLALVVLMMLAAVAIDLGTAQAEKRRLQDLADLAALSAASDPARARDKAVATLSGNGGRAVTLESLATAAYLADPALTPAQRLRPVGATDPAANAVAVSLSSTTMTPFAALLTREAKPRVRAGATAARLGLVSFGLGTGLARYDDGVLNAILGAALGTKLSLTVADYQTLAGFDLTVAELLDAVSARAGLQSGYAETLRATVRLSVLIGAMRDVAARRNAQAAEVLSRLQAVAGTRSLVLSVLVYPPSSQADLVLGDLAPRIRLQALAVLRASADVLNANRVVDLPGLKLNIAGIIGADAKLWVGERAQASGWVTLGAAGATVTTSQSRLWLRLQVAPSLVTGLGPSVTVLRVTIPIYAETAAAVARLTAMDCRAPGSGAVAAGFAPSFAGDVGGSNLARAFIGSFPGADAGLSAPLDPALLAFAPLVDVSLALNVGLTKVTVPLVTFEGKSSTVVGRPSLAAINFAGNEPLPATRSFGQAGLAATLSAALLSKSALTLRTSPASLVGIVLLPVLNLISATQASLANILPGVIPPLADAALTSVMGAAGLGLGMSDLRFDGLRCRVQIVR